MTSARQTSGSPAELASLVALAQSQHRAGRLNAAEAAYRKIIALRPDIAEAHNDLGVVLAERDQLDLAIACFEQALALKPKLPETHFNLGKVLLNQGKRGEAVPRFKQALALKPGYTEAEMYLATSYLLEGDYRRGWRAYEARLRKPNFLSWPHKLPRWTGQPLAGRRVVLLAEPGLGNTILFLRFARLLKERGARVVLAAHSALGRLLANHPDLDEIFTPGSATRLPQADFYLPLLSAPFALRTDASTIPRDVPYLWADPELTAAWQRELAGIEGFKIGIAWQGSPEFRADRFRSVALTRFAPLAAIPGVRLISLQKGAGSEQVAAVDFPVLDCSNRLDETAGSFMDTAAVIRNLDLVVTVDTSIAHLAGALGAPVFVAIHSSPYWTWLLDRDDSPWYPTARLFRQTTPGGWPEVFERIAKAIAVRLAG